jgi:hypothetical protein
LAVSAMIYRSVGSVGNCFYSAHKLD